MRKTLLEMTRKKAVKLMCGDNLELLKGMPDNCVDSVVTDPPYALNFMGKKWDVEVPSVDFWKEVYRVLKPGGHILSFGGTRTYHRMVVNIEDAGFEIRDQIQWIYGSGFPKSMNIEKAINKKEGGESTKNAKDWQGWGTALKPANEPICVTRKPISEKTITDNILKWGTGGINIDGCKVGTETISIHNAPKGTFAGGEPDRGSDTNSYRESEGRWPANIILDEEAGKVLDQQQKNTSRFFYCPKVSKKERNAGCEDLETKKLCQGGYESDWSSDKEGDIGINKVKEYKNNHPTVKPVDLMAYLCRLITPPQGLVLDPFMGSGSTGRAAIEEGFRFVGMEMDKDYFEIAQKRIEYSYKKTYENGND